MGRLIDADVLIDKLVISHTAHSQNAREASLLNRDVRMVMDMPTAYDVEKVVAELEKMSGFQYDCSYGRGCEFDDLIHTPKAIDIVIKGGVDND